MYQPVGHNQFSRYPSGNSGTTTTTRRPTTTRRTTTRRTTTRQTTTQRPTTTTTTTSPPTAPIPPRQACSGSFDAVIRDSSNRIYALTGKRKLYIYNALFGTSNQQTNENSLEMTFSELN